MRWTARVIGLLAAVFLLVILIGEAIAEVTGGGLEPTNQDDTIAGILIGVLGVIALAGCIVSWWHERLAALLLFITALSLGIHIGVYAH